MEAHEKKYREKIKKLRKTIDKIADACIIEEVLYAGKRHLYLVSAMPLSPHISLSFYRFTYVLYYLDIRVLP